MLRSSFYRPNACSSSDLPAYSCAATTPLSWVNYIVRGKATRIKTKIEKCFRSTVSVERKKKQEPCVICNRETVLLCFPAAIATSSIPFRSPGESNVSFLSNVLSVKRCGWMLLLRYSSLWGLGSGCSWLSPATIPSQITAIGKNWDRLTHR